MVRAESVELLVSHNQIRLRSTAFDEAGYRWGDGNVTQGLLWLPGLVAVDPLVEGVFGATVHLRLAERYRPDPLARRVIAVPFSVYDRQQLAVSSAAEEFAVAVAVPAEGTVVYEVCLDEEVYYTFTFLAEPSTAAVPLMDDGWGLTRGVELPAGRLG